MVASELRIGNLVKSGKGTYRVVGVFKSEIVCETMDGMIIDGAFYRPIPITEEWFKKLGFIYYENEYDTTYEIEIKDGYKLEFFKSETYTSVILRWENNVTGDELFYLPNEIKYVHEIQNLYFALTNTELEYVQRP